MTNYDPLLMQNIMAWVGGIAAVAGLTSKVKTIFCLFLKDERLKPIVGYVSSGLVSAAVPSIYLWLTDQFAVKLAALMAISMWMAASGIYDQFKTPEK